MHATLIAAEKLLQTAEAAAKAKGDAIGFEYGPDNLTLDPTAMRVSLWYRTPNTGAYLGSVGGLDMATMTDTPRIRATLALEASKALQNIIGA